MTNQNFPCSKSLQHLHVGPLARHIDTFEKELWEKGYARHYVGTKIRLVAGLSRWLEFSNFQIKDLDEQKTIKFLEFRSIHYAQNRYENSTLRDFLGHLREAGIIPILEQATDDSPLGRIERDFGRYLTQERGLKQATLDNYIPIARQFLSECLGSTVINLDELIPQDITRFILRHSYTKCHSRAQLMVTALRSFLHFVYQRRQTATNLSKCVPTVANWGMSALPKFLNPEEIERLLQSCNQSCSIGRRDYAILLVLARLGLRAGEVVNMVLEDIDWDAGEFLVRGKSDREDRLPLPKDVGEALAAYLCRGRPCCSSRKVFIRMNAPHRGFSSSSSIGDVVQRAFARAGIDRQRKGAHLLRHSLATQMLRRGASLYEIGEILRHQHPHTTEIYAKVDLVALKALAQPWPGGGCHE